MAANNPNPFSGLGGDSQIFRHSSNQKPAQTPPGEPTELIEFDEDDALGSLGGEAPAGESPSMIVRRGYRDGSGVNVDRPKAPHAESDSSIFRAGDPVLPSAPGSGWFDSIPPQRRGKSVSDESTQEIENLFADVEPDSGSSVIPNWKEQQATNSVSESEVLRAFDNLSSRDVTKHLTDLNAGVDYDETQPSGSHIFPEIRSHADDGDSADLNESGVDLLSPDWDSEQGIGPKSSIFGAASKQDASQIELDVLAATESDDRSDHALFRGPIPGDGGSSIFNKNTMMGGGAEGDVDFTAVEGDQESGRIDWATKPQSGAMQPSMDTDFDEAEVDPFGTEAEATPRAKPKRTPGGLVGTSGAGAVIAPPKPRPAVSQTDDDDKPIRPKKSRAAPQSKRGSGVLGWVGGGLAGMVVGAGTVAGLYFTDVLPSNRPAVKSVVQAPANTGELDALNGKQAELTNELAAAKKEAAIAADEARAKGQESADATAEVKLAKSKLALSEARLVSQKVSLAEKTLALTQTEDDSKQAKLAASKAVANLKSAQTETESAKLIASKATDDAKKEAALAQTYRKQFDAANKELEAKTLLANTAGKKLEDADKALAGVVASLKANKLIDDKLNAPAALAALPATFQKLAALNESPDAKKAAEALAAARKENEATKIALDTAEKEKLKAVRDMTAANERAKVQVDTAMKKAQSDVDSAKKEVEAAKKETDSKVTAAVTKAVADAEGRLLQAKAEQAALVNKQKSELVLLQAIFAQQLAETRLGGTQITPGDVLQQEKAARDYNSGIIAYGSRDYLAARTALESAVKLHAADARYWYYLGLTLWELGEATASKDAFTKGSDLEARNRPSASLIGDSLERIQGAARKELNKYR